MSKIIIGGAGGAPSENVIKSICQEPEEVVGVGSEPYDLILMLEKRAIKRNCFMSLKRSGRILSISKMILRYGRYLKLEMIFQIWE